jgi:NifU-like protein involved in Fe-S cluster formation
VTDKDYRLGCIVSLISAALTLALVIGVILLLTR